MAKMFSMCGKNVFGVWGKCMGSWEKSIEGLNMYWKCLKKYVNSWKNFYKKKVEKYIRSVCKL